MPLTAIQRAVLAVIAANRSPESYIAGGAALNRNYPRLSDDLDVFNDQVESLSATAEKDIAALKIAGFAIESSHHYGMMFEAVASRAGTQTNIQWMHESRRRFFPVLRDAEFGARLEDADLAINKVICAANRREARDMIDLVTIAASYCPLGPLIWAATAKCAMGPGQIIAAIRRNASEVTEDQIATVRMQVAPPTRRMVLRDLASALDKADAFISRRAPVETFGTLLTTASHVPAEADAKMIADGRITVRTLSGLGDIVPIVG